MTDMTDEEAISQMTTLRNEWRNAVDHYGANSFEMNRYRALSHLLTLAERGRDRLNKSDSDGCCGEWASGNNRCPGCPDSPQLKAGLLHPSDRHPSELPKLDKDTWVLAQSDGHWFAGQTDPEAKLVWLYDGHARDFSEIQRFRLIQGEG